MTHHFPKVLVVIAGVPKILRDEIAQRLDKIKEDRREFIWLPLEKNLSYESDYIDQLYKKFTSSWRNLYCATGYKASTSNKFEGVLTIYLNHDGGNINLLTNAFEIETLTLGIAVPSILKKLPLNPNELKNASNEIAKNIRNAIKKGEKALPAIAKEITSKTNQTPLLLPDKNYGTKEVRDLIRNVSATIQYADPFLAVGKATKDFEKQHPRVAFGKNKRKYFKNKNGIIFQGPGSARHGLPVDDNEACFVRGTLRLGAPFDPSFHYDCITSDGTLRLKWKSCHEQIVTLPKGRNHVNIAPNDHVR